MSKFLPKAAYQQEDSRYQLLPFQFESLDENRVILTNMVGEFLLVNRAELASIVNHALPKSTDLYAKLRALHIVKEAEERAPIELLSLKTRTKYSRLSNFTNLHIFVVTLRCDHSCQYCQVSRQSENKAAFDMTIETAERSLDLVFRSPSSAIKIEFQGGEPLLNFDLIKLIVFSAKERNKTAQKDLRFVITTTLSLVTDEILYFCRDHRIELSTSLDGPHDLHNKNRPRPGRDSYERFTMGLGRARQILGVDSVSALMTTSPASLPMVREIIDEYVKLDFQGIFLRHLSPYGFALKTKSFDAYNVERWLEFYKEGLEYILTLNKNGINFVEFYSTILLTKMLTSTDPGFVDLMNPSGAGIAAVVYNYDGDVYASDESRMLKEMGDVTFRLGNVATHSYKDIFTSPALLDALEDSFTLSAPMCSDCALEPWCGAEPVFHHAIFGDSLGRKPESDFCRRTMGVAKYLIKAMEIPENARIFNRWVNKC